MLQFINQSISESDFNWDLYSNGFNGSNLKQNKNIKTKNREKIYCHENYAQTLYDAYDNKNNIFRKDLEANDIIPVKSIQLLSNNDIKVNLVTGFTIFTSIKKETKFILSICPTIEYFIEWLQGFDKQTVSDDLGFTIFNFAKAKVIKGGSDPKFSLYEGYIEQIKLDMIDNITNPENSYYLAKVISSNKGGYFVNVCGINCYMPGSLAAANVITDFSTLIGKEIPVLVESYNQHTDSFIVSHKKYIKYNMDLEISKLDKDNILEGVITGISSFGIFIEVNKFFTGLLHTSKFDTETKEKFASRKFRAGDIINIFIDEISKDNKITFKSVDYKEPEKNIE